MEQVNIIIKFVMIINIKTFNSTYNFIVVNYTEDIIGQLMNKYLNYLCQQSASNKMIMLCLVMYKFSRPRISREYYKFLNIDHYVSMFD